MTPAEAAIDQYHRTYEHYATSAQLYAGTELANTVASTAMLFLVAADAEQANPPPSVVRDCMCVACRVYRMLGPKDAPEMERLA